MIRKSAIAIVFIVASMSQIQAHEEPKIPPPEPVALTHNLNEFEAVRQLDANDERIITFQNWEKIIELAVNEKAKGLEEKAKAYVDQMNKNIRAIVAKIKALEVRLASLKELAEEINDSLADVELTQGGEEPEPSN